MENILSENSKSVYHARLMNQRHYNNETYQLQLDSHHRFVEGWDTKSIKLLHSCDAGEYSVLTTYADGYYTEDYSDYYSE